MSQICGIYCTSYTYQQMIPLNACWVCLVTLRGTVAESCPHMHSDRYDPEQGHLTRHLVTMSLGTFTTHPWSLMRFIWTIGSSCCLVIWMVEYVQITPVPHHSSKIIMAFAMNDFAILVCREYLYVYV